MECVDKRLKDEIQLDTDRSIQYRRQNPIKMIMNPIHRVVTKERHWITLKLMDYLPLGTQRNVIQTVMRFFLPPFINLTGSLFNSTKEFRHF